MQETPVSKRVWAIEFEDDGEVNTIDLANIYSEELEQQGNWPNLRIRKGTNDLIIELLAENRQLAVAAAFSFKENLERILKYER